VSAIKQTRKGVKATRCTYAKSRTIFALHVPNTTTHSQTLIHTHTHTHRNS